MTTPQTHRHPARVLAVATMLIDVLDHLCDVDGNLLTPSETELLMFLALKLGTLRSIRDQSRTEMAQFAPAVLLT